MDESVVWLQARKRLCTRGPLWRFLCPAASHPARCFGHSDRRPSLEYRKLMKAAVHGDACLVADILDGRPQLLLEACPNGITPLVEAAKYLQADVVIVMVERGWPWKYHRREPLYSAHHVDHLLPCEELLLSLSVSADAATGAGDAAQPEWSEQDLRARSITIDSIRNCFPKPQGGWPEPPSPPKRGRLTVVGGIVAALKGFFSYLGDESSHGIATDADAMDAVRALFDLVLDNHWRTMQLVTSEFLTVVDLLLRDYLSMAAEAAYPRPRDRRAAANLLYYLSHLVRDAVMAASLMAAADPAPRLKLIEEGIVRVAVELLDVHVGQGGGQNARFACLSEYVSSLSRPPLHSSSGRHVCACV